jgi:hypothetical protein
VDKQSQQADASIRPTGFRAGVCKLGTEDWRGVAVRADTGGRCRIGPAAHGRQVERQHDSQRAMPRPLG